MATATIFTKLDDFSRSLAKEPPQGGIIFILSEDEQLRELAVSALEKAVNVDYSDDFNVSRFDARDSLEEAVLAARSYPMMADYRYVRVDHLEGLKGGKSADKPASKSKSKAKSGEKGGTEKEGDPFTQYLQDPLSSTLLLLSASKMDQRTKLFTTLKKAALILCDLKVPNRRELPSWIDARARVYGLDIGSEAISLLADVVGSNLQLIERSLEQLRDYLYPDKVVPPSAIEEMICRSKSQSIFDMTDAIGAGDGVKALAMLRDMEEDGEPALMVSAMITRHFRQLLTVAAAVRHGGSSYAIGQSLGLPPFIAGKLVDQAKNMSLKGLMAVFPRLLDLDIALKSGAPSPYGAIEDMLLEIMPLINGGTKR